MTRSDAYLRHAAYQVVHLLHQLVSRPAVTIILSKGHRASGDGTNCLFTSNDDLVRSHSSVSIPIQFLHINTMQLQKQHKTGYSTPRNHTHPISRVTMRKALHTPGERI